MSIHDFKLILLIAICLLCSQCLIVKKLLRTDATSDYADKWVYFKLNDTIEIKIIEHHVAPVWCHESLITASETIGNTGTDTIRVIELCNTNKVFIKGEIVKVIPMDSPNSQVTLPLYIGKDPTFYEFRVLKTTYGQIIAK